MGVHLFRIFFFLISTDRPRVAHLFLCLVDMISFVACWAKCSLCEINGVIGHVVFNNSTLPSGDL